MQHRALLLVLALGAGTAVGAWAGVPSTSDDFYLPGSQPCESAAVLGPGRCDDCHGGFNALLEMTSNWRGSMMSHAARDPVFLAALAVANQDAANAGELCLRCHAPAGWLAGRAVADASELEGADRQGVQCGFCHRLVKPATPGSNPYWNDPEYTAQTYPFDQEFLASLAAVPPASANGMFLVDDRLARRGPFTDATPRHAKLYSPFHRDGNLCATCHDMSNPLLSRRSDGGYALNAFGEPAGDFHPRAMKAIERTGSEWAWSAYNTPLGIEAPQFGGNRATVSTCQDCHMRDVTGVAAVTMPATARTDMPLHDMTGGNTATPAMVAWLHPAAVDPAAIAAGTQRARSMLQKAATLQASVVPALDEWIVRVRVVNNTGHRLPTGFPEGRRMWVHLRATDAAGNLVFESGAYDAATATLTRDAAIKVYEHAGGLSPATAAEAGLPAGPSYHTVLNDVVLCDNRIPPRGFRNLEFGEVQAAPVGAAYADGQYWDETEYVLPIGAAEVSATLMYQSVTREYVEFLRDANVTNRAGRRLYNAWSATGRAAPETMAATTVRIGPSVDRQPPAKPLGVIARATSSSAIVLTWAPSLDDVGVVGYRVLRDGLPVGAPAAPAFQDFGLKASTAYEYVVQALDAAGNLSEPSDPVRATTKSGFVRGGGGVRGLEPAIAARPAGAEGAVDFAYVLPEAGRLELEVFDVTGRLVGGCSESVSAGEGVLRWSGRGLPRGLYFARLTHAGGTLTTRFVLNR